ncbi:hypothetical protein QBC42DRAFT_308718 [Cladorrhinum samala]|uniref:Uncharacterized protein n=1 Tax=Cladorrhinum samala TaxID=585594 RepID=A0AAV9HFS9_9PEZI|nr:hypothetical protein QBC42DRAFT_308718 [Cladorrhinum samala]
MLTFRRALVAAAFFITIIFLTTRSSAPAASSAAVEFPKVKPGADKAKQQESHTTASSEQRKSDSHAVQTGGNRGGGSRQGQIPIKDMSKMTLYEKLAYQFPYDVETKFPAYIWQTWKWTPAHGEFEFREQEATWTEQHPGFTHEVITDQVAVHLLRLLYASVPEVLEAYEALPLPVLKADFFRYLILLARGGIYSDIDTYAIRSALEWIPDSVPHNQVGLVIGIEADPDRPDWKDWYSRRIQFCQWTIQSKPGHPVLREVVSRITSETLKRKRSGSVKDLIDKNVIEFTGPALWTDTIFEYFNDARYFDMSNSAGPIDWRNFTGMETPRRVGDTIVLPITSFSPGVQQMGAKDYDDPMAFVKHDFEGTWKPESEQKPPLLQQTIPENFASVVSQHGDRPAVVSLYPSRFESTPQALLKPSITYHELDTLSNELAHSLRSSGVRKGDRVAVSLGNCWEFAALTYAIFKLGAILVPLNPLFKADQVAAALNHLDTKLLIISAVCDRRFKPWSGRSNYDLLKTIIPDLHSGRVESPLIPTLEKVIVVENQSLHHDSPFPPLNTLPSLTPFHTLLAGSSGAGSSPAVTPDSPLSPSETINIQFTSGTTAKPKAAMLSHTGILNNGYLIANRMNLVPTDRIVCPPPLFHCFGSILGYMATATTGAAIMFPSPAFDPASSMEMATNPLYGATGLYGVSTIINTNLRKGIAAGSSIPEPLMNRIISKLGLDQLVICYGMTETSPVSCMTAPDDPFDKRTATVGRVMPHTGVKIVDPTDRSKILPIGERGELAASGYLVMKGYWGDRELTEEVRIPDAETGEVWMYSGDEARMDAEGYVEITGRIKDLIIRGGENIHPLEIESCLFSHEGVAEVSVVGVEDKVYGESVVAFVIAHEAGETGRKGTPLDEETLKEFVRGKMSAHLVPKHVFFVKDFPKTASGKIQKFKLRETAERLVRELEGQGGK